LTLALLAVPVLWRFPTEPVGGTGESDGDAQASAASRSPAPPDGAEAPDPGARPRDAGAPRRADREAPADAPASELPRLIAEALGDEDGDGGPQDARVTNRNLAESGVRAFDPRDLAALRDIIAANGLDEDSSLFDYDDGDHLLEPWELGFQVWVGGRLVALSFGPDPYASFRYGVQVLPESVGDLSGLRYLDLAGNQLGELPDGIGDLRELRTLRLNRNSLAELPDSVGELWQLRVLNLSRNQLDALPRSFADLGSLERLYVDDNRFASFPLVIAWLESLRELGFSHRAAALADEPGSREGPLLDELPAGVVELPALDRVIVTGNRIHCGGGVTLVSAGAGAPGTLVFGLSAQRCSGGGLQ
jgi:hypothetical protein